MSSSLLSGNGNRAQFEPSEGRVALTRTQGLSSDHNGTGPPSPMIAVTFGAPAPCVDDLGC